MDDHIVKALALHQFLRGNVILTHNAAAFADTQRRAGADIFTILITRQIFPEEVHQRVDLAAQLQLCLEEGLHFGAVHTVDLCGIEVTLALMHGRSHTDSGVILRNDPLLCLLLAPVQKPLTFELHIADIANADDAIFCHIIHEEFQCYRLHQAVIAAFFDFTSGKFGHIAVAGGIDDYGAGDNFKGCR